MSTYKLYYFNARGRGEVARLIFTVAGQKFEDIRYEQSEWASHKAEMPLGQVPVLEFDGVKLPQTVTIARFLGKQFQLAGKDNLEQAKVDAVADTINDLVTAFAPIYGEQDQTKKQELTNKLLTNELPKHLTNLEVLAKLYGNGGHFFVGNNLTWVDLLAYVYLGHVLQISENAFDTYPWLKQNREEVEKIPKIKEYLNNRPQTAS